MRRVFLTGANRGIGLEFTRQLLERGDRVFAGVRNPNQPGGLAPLVGGPRLSLIPIDVTGPALIYTAAHLVTEEADALDMVINNAGVLNRDERIETFDARAFQDTFEVNVTGAAIVAKHFTPLLERGNDALLVNISSQLGSIARKAGGSTYSYSASKAALNMLTKAMSHELKPRGITTVALHPGWVQTDMGGQGATLTPHESVRGMLSVLDGLTPQASGTFLQWDGQALPW